MTDDQGVVVWEADYKPFGQATVNPSSEVENNFRFPGQYYDKETGLQYNWHRYYNPATGRYLTPDPIGLIGGINLYLYSLNNPINLIDPLGLDAADIIPGIRKALIEGARASVYSVGEAAKATSDIAMHGPPLAKVAIGVAAVSEIAPLSGAAAISALPSATSIALSAAPYSGAIVDFTYGFFVETGPPKGWGYLSSGALTIYDEIKRIVLEQNTSTCEN
jgi:RHS repeat-associated protein